MPSILTRPSGGGAAFSATVAVSVDNSTPDIGDTIQITATPSGITPTSYLFFSKDSANVMTLIGEQAGNVISWEASGSTGRRQLLRADIKTRPIQAKWVTFVGFWSQKLMKNTNANGNL